MIILISSANSIKLSMTWSKLLATGFPKISQTLSNIGFHASVNDSFVFICLCVLIYVDDIITGNTSTVVQQFINALQSKFSLKDLGYLYYFLGIKVSPTYDGTLPLTQTKYIKELIHWTNMQVARIRMFIFLLFR